MKLNMDTIQFESHSEVEKMIEVIEKYVDAYPREKDNSTVKEFYNLLDVMDISW